VRPAPLRLRRAVPADAPAMVRTMTLGFETYVAFAPRGWRPPPDEAAGIRAGLAEPGVWALLADVAGEPAGHGALVPGAGEESRTVHLWQLFVRPRWWGSGLAATLHDAFLERARDSGYARARLLTPAAQARARRFYARRGWRVDGPAEPASMIGLMLVTMRRPL
jgi:GNAT superfamily N-acetyltransferase